MSYKTNTESLTEIFMPVFTPVEGPSLQQLPLPEPPSTDHQPQPGRAVSILQTHPALPRLRPGLVDPFAGSLPPWSLRKILLIFHGSVGEEVFDSASNSPRLPDEWIVYYWDLFHFPLQLLSSIRVVALFFKVILIWHFWLTNSIYAFHILTWIW